MDVLEANGFDQGEAHEVSEYLIAGQIAIRDRADVKMTIQNRLNPRMIGLTKRLFPECCLVLKKVDSYT